MKDELKWFWVSFSLDGTNVGVCNIQAISDAQARIKINDLGIMPKFDHASVYEHHDKEMEPNRLYSRDEMIEMGYEKERKPITS